jgi:hypothetical protein
MRARSLRVPAAIAAGNCHALRSAHGSIGAWRGNNTRVQTTARLNAIVDSEGNGRCTTRPNGTTHDIADRRATVTPRAVSPAPSPQARSHIAAPVIATAPRHGQMVSGRAETAPYSPVCGDWHSLYDGELPRPRKLCSSVRDSREHCTTRQILDVQASISSAAAAHATEASSIPPGRINGQQESASGRQCGDRGNRLRTVFDSAILVHSAHLRPSLLDLLLRSPFPGT